MRGSAKTMRIPLAAALALLLLLLMVVVGRLWCVHERTWDWSLMVAATPPKIEFADRTYLRGSDAVAPAQALEVGRTLGGGVILSNAWPAAYVPTVIWVRSASTTLAYSLAGGP